MAKDATYTRRINLYINGKEVKNNVSSIKGEMRKLIAAQNKMTIGSNEYVKTGKKISQLNTILKKHRQQISKTGKGLSLLGGKMKFLIAAGASGMAYGLLGLLKKIGTNSVKFQKALSSLSAITGATGEDLEFYANAAKETSKVTLQGATDIVKAYELVGSARPELLRNKEALAEVTKQSIILSEATGGKLGLENAAKATASALNQYGLASEDAGKAINVLAAGSKEGAAAVPLITESIDKFGAVASNGNVTLEQSVGLIETLAEKNIVGAEAGIKLRNILIKLQSDQSNYKNGVFDLNLALQNLSESNMTITEMTKKFGNENVVAAKILERSTDKIKKYTAAVTDTNVALEQQAIQNNNAISAWKKFMNYINEKLTSGPLAGWLTEKINGLTTAIENFERKMMSAGELSGKHMETLMGNINKSANAEEKINRITKAIEREKETMQGYIVQQEQLSWFAKQNLWWKPAKDANALSKAVATSKANIEALQKELKKAQKESVKESFNFSGNSTAELIDLESKYLEFQDLLTEKQKLKLQAIQDEIKARNQATKTSEESQDNKQMNDENLDKLKALNDKKKELEEKLANEISQIRRKLNQEGKSQQEQERAQIEQKYADLKKEVEAEEAEMKKEAESLGVTAKNYEYWEEYKSQVKKLHDGEIATHEKKWAQKQLEEKQKLEDQIFELTASEQEKEIKSVTEKYQKIIKLAEEAGLDTAELYQSMNDKLTEINDQGPEINAFGFIQNPDKWEEIQQNFETAIGYINKIGSLWGSINQIQSNKEQAAFNKYKANTEKQKELLNDRLDQGLISQEQYNARVANLDADLDKKQKKMQQEQTERQKKQQMFEAAVNTAAAIVEALPNIPLSILVGTLGAAQIAAIASEPVPEYAQGGFTQGDRIYRAGEKGREWIASNDMLMNPYTGPIIQMLDDVRQRRTPASIFAPARPNVAEVVESMPSYSRGGYTAPARTETKVIQQNVPQTDSETTNVMRQMAQDMRSLTAYMSDPKNRQAVINYNTLKRQNQEDELRNRLGKIK
jgi:TP901 family phage tail tape measure protein